MGFGLLFRFVSGLFILSFREWWVRNVLMIIVLIADSVRACGRVFAEAKRVSTVGMNGDAKKTS